MAVPNHIRDRVYGIIADPTMDPAAKQAALQSLSSAGTQTAAAIAAPSVTMPSSTMAMPDVPRAPNTAPIPRSTGAFTSALAALPATPAPTAPVAGPPTAAFPNVNAPPSAAFPDAAPPGLGDEIDRRRALTLAALSQPTTYPAMR